MPPLPTQQASESLVKRQLHEFITEHFGFSPESFTSRAVDLANEVIYDTVDQVEKVVRERFGDTDEIELGLHRLETLLEGQVDARFDLCELYLMRNIFTFPPELLPFARIHKDNKQDQATDHDESLKLSREVLEERRQVEELLEQAEGVKAVHNRIEERIALLKACKEELVGWGLKGDRSAQLPEYTQKLLVSLPQMQTQTQRLLETKSPQELSNKQSNENMAETEATATTTTISRPWHSREAYISWASSRKLGPNEHSMDELIKSIQNRGSDKDIKAVLGMLKE